jgi:outer membrane protein
MIQVNIPLYQGGGPAAQVRRSHEVHKQRQLQVDQARNLARQAAANAWDARSSAQADLNARQVQSKAAGLALEGLQRQQARGNRTVLDVLNGHQEWLNAQLAENKARRDLAVSEYRILAAIGRLSLEELPLPSVLSVDLDGIVTKRWTDFNVRPPTK